MADSLIENVSDTAFWVAYYRGVETRRRDALFHDPLADLLAGEQGKKIAHAMPMRFMTEWIVAMRTCMIDDFIQNAVADGVDTVVNLGTGLDTRPYRMDLPSSLLWVEADYPRMIEYKNSRLSGHTPRCRLERVGVDLADDAERRRVLADIDSRATKLLILTEGVIVYLPEAAVGVLADDLKALQHARCWIIEYLSPQALKFRERSEITQRTKNAPFRFKPADWFGFFREHGWGLKEIRHFSEQGKRLKRPPQFPLRLKLLMKLRTLFASRKRREAMGKAAGYALLEPTGDVAKN
jgi:methyltransferase (TIGR00027 family)